MKRSLRRFTGSAVAQVTGLTIGGLFLLNLVFGMIVQTPLVFRVFPWALADNAKSIAELVWLIENVPEDIEPYILSTYRGSGRSVTIRPAPAAGLKDIPALRRQLENEEDYAGARLVGRDIRFGHLGFAALRRASSEPGAIRGFAALLISVPVNDGRVMEFRLSPSVYLASRPRTGVFFIGILLFWSVMTALALSAVTLRPLRLLERDAERIDLREVGPAVAEHGPIEVRRVAAALNAMRRRLSGLVSEREQIIAAIAHDIRTGITRVRLRTDGRDAIAPAELERDLEQMEALVSDMLAYARAENPSGPRELVDLGAFFSKFSEDHPSPIDLVTDAGSGFSIVGDRVALHRLFDNLLENARRYGGESVRLVVQRTEDVLEARVEDEGPGLPEPLLEAVFEPFRRGEASRSRETGGSGLGLGIARAIARAHGATLHLENRGQGGLAAIVRFPEHLEA